MIRDSWIQSNVYLLRTVFYMTRERNTLSNFCYHRTICDSLKQIDLFSVKDGKYENGQKEKKKKRCQ